VAKEVAEWPSFPYAPATQGGRLGCAQVGSHILVKAGELSREHLAVKDLCRDAAT
jgi:hypothetical protein